MNGPNSALLIMDFQDEIAGSDAGKVATANLKPVLDAVRAKNMPVVFVVVGFRPGYPEVAASNGGFSSIKASGRLVMPKVIEALAPLPSEPVVTKRRVSSLHGTDLGIILSGYEVGHLVMAGISTSGVILSTTRAAADLDYRITILSDCCADTDPEVHAVLMGKILPRQAKVISSQEFIATLSPVS